MPEREKAGRKAVEEVERLRARVAKLERIALRKAGPNDSDRELDRAWSEWETTFDAIGDSVILLDSEFNILQANAATSILLGKPLDEIVGQRCCKLVHGSNEPLENCPMVEAKTTKKRQKAEFYIVEKGIWALISVDPILDEQGNMTRAVHIIRDITDRKRIEEDLVKSEQNYRSIFDAANDAIFVHDAKTGRVLDVNRKMCEMYVCTPQEARHLDVGALSSGQAPYTQRDALQLISKAAEGEPQLFEWHAKDAQGRLFWVEVNLKKATIAGEMRLLAVVRDITERKKAEETLCRQTCLLNSINRVLTEALTCETEADLARTCLAVAEELNGSRFGFVCEVTPAQRSSTIAISDPGWHACRMPKTDAVRAIENMPIRGIWGRVIQEERAIIFNDPSSDPAWIGIPHGHPKITSFLGVPLKHAGKTIGMIALANKESGYDLADQQDIEALSVSFVEALMRRRAEQQVRQSEQKYKELFESAREAIIIMDLDGKITDANRIVEEYGLKRDQLLGKSIFDFIPVNHRARAAKDFGELCHGTVVKGEMEVIAPKGSFTVEYRDNPIVREGQIVAVQAILMDITERKMVTDKLMRLSKILKMIARVNQDMFLIKDRNRLLQSVCRRIVGHPYKMVWIGFCDGPTKKVVPAAQAGFEEGYLNSIKVTYDDSEYGRGPTGTAIRTNKPCVVRSTAKDPVYEPWRKEALKRGCRSSAAIPIVSGERVIGALNVYSEKEDAFGDEEIGLLEELAHDISTGLRAIDEENKRIEAEKNLKTYQAELKSLASELVLAEERERRRIAAGIHDGISQKLALAKMELQLLIRSPGKSKIPASLDSVCSRIDEAIKDAHSLTFELSNPALYDLSFAAAIELWLLEQIQKKHGIKCTVIADEQAVPLDENSKVVLFRALRELAVNVVKHAKATALTVAIEKLEDSVQITCKDDGLGFTPSEGGPLPRDVGGFGLFNIKERLEYLGGGMKLESAPGRGTLITLSLPLERKSDAGADEGRQ